MNRNKISSIIFDLDDTLLPSSHFYPQAVAYTLNESSEKIALFQEARRQVKADLPVFHCSARNRLLYFKRYLELLQDRQSSAITLYQKYENFLGQIICQWSKENLRTELLEMFKEGHQLYILTNENTRSQLAKVEALCQGKSIFSGILTSEEVGYEKPDLRMFQQLFRRFELNVENCLYLGDSVENDIAPAKRLELRCVLSVEFADQITSGHRFPLESISQLSQLREFL